MCHCSAKRQHEPYNGGDAKKLSMCKHDCCRRCRDCGSTFWERAELRRHLRDAHGKRLNRRGGARRRRAWRQEHQEGQQEGRQREHQVPASAVSACAVPPPLQSEASTVWRTPALEGNRPVIVPAAPPLMLPRGASGPAGPSLPCPQQSGPGSWTLHQDFRECDAGVRRWVMTWTFRPDTATQETQETQETEETEETQETQETKETHETKEPQETQEEDSELGAEPDLGFWLG